MLKSKLGLMLMVILMIVGITIGCKEDPRKELGLPPNATNEEVEIAKARKLLESVDGEAEQSSLDGINGKSEQENLDTLTSSKYLDNAKELMIQKKYLEAIEEINEAFYYAIEGNVSDKRLSEIHTLYGDNARNLYHYQEAKNQYIEAIKLDDDNKKAVEGLDLVDELLEDSIFNYVIVQWVDGENFNYVVPYEENFEAGTGMYYFTQSDIGELAAVSRASGEIYMFVVIGQEIGTYDMFMRSFLKVKEQLEVYTDSKFTIDPDSNWGDGYSGEYQDVNIVIDYEGSEAEGYIGFIVFY
ncbi:MAG: hypothetical protein JXR88_14460 [Clostridia bacterium]|nr:hypothetical protein [Clostridia bacterium]